ncbi:hypothetical protein GCM10023201_53820 [Actinomycetospora corticicola]|uniref:Uncharacterized protein n=1 Tax=Actinomycetospora corticicola TaxID=663602 RepID=A0A7Y9DZR2_9PSEU|nr:hypothetical protein [Actinomycetospora corticicola]NYD38563.1 hypothetical protein [Actinomycetospora corticicola]
MSDESIYRAVEAEAKHYDDNPDGDEWEPVPAPVPASAASRRQLRSVLSVRFAPEELDRIKAEADREGVTVSSYVRAVTLGSVSGVSKQQGDWMSTSNGSHQVIFRANHHVGETFSEVFLRHGNDGVIPTSSLSTTT